MYTYDYIVKSLPKNKSSVSSFWVKAVARPLSFLFTFIFVNLKCTANFISVLSGIVSVIGCVLLAMPNTAAMVTGVVLINFWIVLDCVDGNIARVTHKSTRMGEFFDAAYGFIICAFDFLAIGIAAYNWSSVLFGKKAIANIIIGALACSFNILPRLVYQKYTVMTMALSEGSGKVEIENDSFYDPNKRKGLTYLRLVIDRQIGTSGLFMPFLIICAIFKCFDIMGLFYCVYLGVSCVAVFVMFSMKADRINKEYAQKRGQ
jgi:phosphatidylglycerophosphate synthase